MIIEFHCSHCGNTDPKKVSEYDRLLGYECVTCLVCNWKHDHSGSFPPEESTKEKNKE